jgi:hypothetical protein
MLELPQFAVEDRDEIASLVRQHPWAVVAGLGDDEVHADPELAATMRHRPPEPNGEPR